MKHDETCDKDSGDNFSKIRPTLPWFDRKILLKIKSFAKIYRLDMLDLFTVIRTLSEQN